MFAKHLSSIRLQNWRKSAAIKQLSFGAEKFEFLDIFCEKNCGNRHSSSVRDFLMMIGHGAVFKVCFLNSLIV